MARSEKKFGFFGVPTWFLLKIFEIIERTRGGCRFSNNGRVVGCQKVRRDSENIVGQVKYRKSQVLISTSFPNKSVFGFPSLLLRIMKAAFPLFDLAQSSEADRGDL